MPKRALVQHRPWLLLSIAGAVAYYFLRSEPWGEAELMVLKGIGVSALAIYAWQRHPGDDAKLLALVMALSAAGDMLIEVSLSYGGAAFLLAHSAAMALYLRNPRDARTASQKGVAVTLLLVTPLMCWLLSRDIAVAIYGFALGGMAASAWMSRFSRYRVGLGAILFVISDWLIFAGLGPLGAPGLSALLVWPVYYIGQFLIATGVMQTLRKELEAAA